MAPYRKAPSAGGQIALVLAATAPGRVRSLVLAGTGLVLFPADDPVSQQIREHVARLDETGPIVAFERRPADVVATYESLWGHAEATARGRLASYRDREA